MEERVLKEVRESIQNNDYIIGLKTRFSIITVKMSDSKYYVILVEDKQELQSDIEDSLKKAKIKGLEMWLAHSSSAHISNLSMYHFKHDRPNNRPWQKDSVVVLESLLAELNVNIIRNVNQAEGGRSEGVTQPKPSNIIMYGPPGTGKTYHTIYKSLELMMHGDGSTASEAREPSRCFSKYTS